MSDDYYRTYKRLKEVYESRIKEMDKHPLECKHCIASRLEIDKLDKLKEKIKELSLENWRLKNKMKTLLR